MRIPTLAEMLRIKAWLIVRRNATRDYLDFAALAERLGPQGNWEALCVMDELYPQPNGESVLRQLARQLAEPKPYDLSERGLTEYRIARPPWDRWDYVCGICANIATLLLGQIGRDRR